MVSEELQIILDQLNKQGKMHYIEAATQEQIESFEKKHDIKLPIKYKEWLLYSDGGEFYLPAGVQMYGVAHTPLIDVNDDDRPNDNYIVIGALASGDPILYEKTKEAISIYNHEEDCTEDDEVYCDYVAFLNDLGSLLGIEE